MQKQVFPDLKALTKWEVLVRQFERCNKVGSRGGGVGLMRVDRTNNYIWVIVAINDLLPKNCPDCENHPNMELMLTTEYRAPNCSNAVFCKCTRLVDRDQSPQNIYPIYPYENMRAEMGSRNEPEIYKYRYTGV